MLGAALPGATLRGCRAASKPRRARSAAAPIIKRRGLTARAGLPVLTLRPAYRAAEQMSPTAVWAPAAERKTKLWRAPQLWRPLPRQPTNPATLSNQDAGKRQGGSHGRLNTVPSARHLSPPFGPALPCFLSSSSLWQGSGAGQRFQGLRFQSAKLRHASSGRLHSGSALPPARFLRACMSMLRSRLRMAHRWLQRTEVGRHRPSTRRCPTRMGARPHARRHGGACMHCCNAVRLQSG